MLLRAIPLLSALALLLSATHQASAALVSAPPASLPPAAAENASTAFLPNESESQIGLLCHNDPVNRSDPDGLIDVNSSWGRLMLWQGGGDGTISEQTTRILAIAALDRAAPWATANRKEVAGVINRKGESVEGPEKGRTGLSSDPGVKPDSAATWHLHHLGMPGAVKGAEYRFSRNTFGASDSNLLRDHPNIPHYVGVLDGPPGKFTIFGYISKDQPFVYIRPNYGVTPGFDHP